MYVRKQLLSLLLILFFGNLILSAASRPQKAFSAEGYVRSYGNIPFSFPGLETSDGKKYRLECDSSLKKKLLESTGKRICVYGELEDSPTEEKLFPLKDGTIFVTDFYYSAQNAGF